MKIEKPTFIYTGGVGRERIDLGLNYLQNAKCFPNKAQFSIDFTISSQTFKVLKNDLKVY